MNKRQFGEALNNAVGPNPKARIKQDRSRASGHPHAAFAQDGASPQTLPPLKLALHNISMAELSLAMTAEDLERLRPVAWHELCQALDHLQAAREDLK